MTLDYEDKNADVAEMRAHERSALLRDISAVIATPEGKQFVRHVLAAANIYSAPCQETNTMYYTAGARNLGMFVLSECIAANPEHAAQALIQIKPKKEGTQ